METKRIEIDSADEKDVNDMFNEICEQVIGKSPLSVKRDILDFDGSDKQIYKETVTLQDLIDFMKVCDVKFEFKLKALYTVTDEKRDFIPDFSGGQKVCEVHKNMESQKKEITNPELKEVVEKKNNEAPNFIEEKTVLDPNKIEDFNL